MGAVVAEQASFDCLAPRIELQTEFELVLLVLAERLRQLDLDRACAPEPEGGADEEGHGQQDGGRAGDVHGSSPEEEGAG